MRLIRCLDCGFCMNVEKLCKSRKTLVCICSREPLATRKENGVWDLCPRARMTDERVVGRRP